MEYSFIFRGFLIIVNRRILSFLYLKYIPLMNLLDHFKIEALFPKALIISGLIISTGYLDEAP